MTSAASDAHRGPSVHAPIGVFDSGVGGLTVLRALRAELPAEDFIYLGDTARLPYGTKSRQTVVRYALQAASAIVDRGIKCLVVACNTASAAALPAMRDRFAGLSIVGVIEPGAQSACSATRNRRIAVIATEGTVRGGAYQEAIARREGTAVVTATPCQLFVALAEEGWTSGDAALTVAHRYLDPLFASRSAFTPDTLVLGCTHFPMLTDVIRTVVGPDVAIVDSAATTARATVHALEAAGLRRSGRPAGTTELLATDGPERFARVGGRFLGDPLSTEQITLVDL